MTAGGREVSVDRGRLKAAEALLAGCEVQAGSLPCMDAADADAQEDVAAKLLRCEQTSQTPAGRDLLGILNPPDHSGQESSSKRGFAYKDFAVDGTGALLATAGHNRAPTEQTQDSNKFMGKFMTAGGQEVSVDRGRLKAAEALLAGCEVQAGSLPCMDVADADAQEDVAAKLLLCEQTSQTPAGLDSLGILNPPDHSSQERSSQRGFAYKDFAVDGTGALLATAGHNRAPTEQTQDSNKFMGKFMTAGGQEVSVDRGRLKAAEALLAGCEVQAGSLPCTDAADPDAQEDVAAKLLRCEQTSQTPAGLDLLGILNPPDHSGQESSSQRGFAYKDFAVDGTGALLATAGHNRAPTEQTQDSNKFMGKFMTAGGQEVSVDRGRLKAAEALLAGCEVQAGSLPCTDAADADAQEDVAAKLLLCEQTSQTPAGLDSLGILNPPDHSGQERSSQRGFAYKDFAVDGTGALLATAGHNRAPTEPTQDSNKFMGKFMTAGGQEVSVDRGRLKAAEALLAGCEVQAGSLPCTDAADPDAHEDVAAERLGSGLPEHTRQESSCLNSVHAQCVPSQAFLQRWGEFNDEHMAPAAEAHSGHSANWDDMPTASTFHEAEAWPAEDAPHEEMSQKAPQSLALAIREDWKKALGAELPARYGDKWLCTQLAQFTLLSARFAKTVDSSTGSLFKRLVKRAQAELSGRRSAIFQICAGLAPADQHMVLMCTDARLNWQLWIIDQCWNVNHHSLWASSQVFCMCRI